MEPGTLPLGYTWVGIEPVQGPLALLGESSRVEMHVQVPQAKAPVIMGRSLGKVTGTGRVPAEAGAAALARAGV